MPAESKTATLPADAKADPSTPKKKTAGKAAIAKVTLLDGSVLEVTIDVRLILFWLSIFLINFFFFFSVKPVELTY